MCNLRNIAECFCYCFFQGSKGIQDKTIVYNFYNAGVSKVERLALPEPQVSPRWQAALEKQRIAAQGSGGSGGVDFIATPNGTAVHASQAEMINSITNTGAVRIGPTTQTSEIGQIFHMNTKYGPMESRVMPGQPGSTNAYRGPRTINTVPGTSEYVYPNGERIRGAISKSDRKGIGHIHGQR